MATILIIDDDASVRAAIQQCLTKAGHTVVLAGHGREGMGVLRQATVDLVVTDLFMPEQEGLETITALRKQHPQLPIIAMSGGNLASEAMLSVARELGAREVIEKPFGLDRLLAAVEKVLHEKVEVLAKGICR
jgi:DNA-binding NtrC family response regulator